MLLNATTTCVLSSGMHKLTHHFLLFPMHDKENLSGHLSFPAPLLSSHPFPRLVVNIGIPLCCQQLFSNSGETDVNTHAQLATDGPDEEQPRRRPRSQPKAQHQDRHRGRRPVVGGGDARSARGPRDEQ